MNSRQARTTHASSLRHTTRIVSGLLILLTLIGVAAPALAQPAEDAPLILVAVPDEFGATLAARLQARLNGTAPGYRVLTTHAAITSEADAITVGLAAGVYLVIWPGETASTLNLTLPAAGVITPGPFTVQVRLDPDDARLFTAGVRAITGQALALAGACDAAAASLTGARQSAPADWPLLSDVYYYQGVCHVLAGDTAAAQAGFADAVRHDLDSWYAWHGLAWMHANAEDWQLGVAAMNEAITLHDDAPGLYLDRAYMREQLAGWDGAISDYTTAIALNPEHPEAYRRRAQLYQQTGQLQAALADYDTLITLLPGDPYVLLGRAEVQIATGEYELALQDLDAALSLNPADDAPFLFQRGVAQLYTGQFADAILTLEAYTSQRPEDASGWINLAEAHYGAEDIASAIDAYENALAADPAATHLYSTLARLTYELAQALGGAQNAYWQQTIDYATLALAAYDRDATAYLYRALAHMAWIESRGPQVADLSGAQQAVDDLSAALRIDPFYEAALYNRGIVYTWLGNRATDDAEQAGWFWLAVTDYDALLDIDPDYYRYLQRYQAYLYVELGEYAAAVAAFDGYTAAYPDAEYGQTFTYYQGVAYRAVGQIDEAVTAFTATLGGFSRYYDCEARLGLGLIAGLYGEDFAQANDHLRRYLADNCPTNALIDQVARAYHMTWRVPTP